MGRIPDTVTPVSNAFGNNEMGPAGSFIFRKFWKENGMPTKLDAPEPVDFWYGSLFHGRIDREGFVIYPSEKHLKQIPGVEGGVAHFALDFVVDAFSDLRKHFMKAQFRRVLCEESYLYQPDGLNVSQAWASVNVNYNTYIENLYNYIVTGWFQRKQRNIKIKNFSDFLHEFMEVVQADNKLLPFTKSAYILSKYFTPLSSGLVIEVGADAHSVDVIKEKGWVKDENFPFYRASAEKFGFRVDKNAPWRLVADINNPIMKKYMEGYGNNGQTYGVTPDNLFDKYFYRCYLLDIETLKRYLVFMYNAYVDAYPQAKEFRTKLKGSGGVRTISRLIRRKPTTLKEVNKQFSPAFWLKTYYYIRLREMGVPRNPVEFNKNLKKILQQNKVFDFDTALSYTDNMIRKIKVR